MLRIIIEPDATVSIDAIGYQGQDCLLATKPFELALGTTTAEVPKPELFQPTTPHVHTSQAPDKP